MRLRDGIGGMPRGGLVGRIDRARLALLLQFEGQLVLNNPDTNAESYSLPSKADLRSDGERAAALCFYTS